MFQRIAPLSRSLLRVQAATPSRRFAHGFKPEIELVREHKSGLADIPVPAGPWAEYHSKRNAKWTMLLVASVGFFGFTMFAMWQQGIWDLNEAPPMKNKK